MSSLQSNSNIGVWTFLRSIQTDLERTELEQTEWGFVYEIIEPVGISRTKVSVFPIGETRISHPHVQYGEITDIPTSMVHSLKIITKKNAEKLIEVIS